MISSAPLPRSSYCASIYAFFSKLAPITVTWADSVCLHRSLEERSRESRKTKVDKAIDILKVKVGKCPHNRHWGTLTGKSINNRKRGRSQKRADLIVYCFRNIYTSSVFCNDKHKKNFDIQFSMKRHETV